MGRILGKLIWLCNVLPQGKPFLQRGSIPLRQKSSTLRPSRQLKAGPRMWWRLCGSSPARVPNLFVPECPWMITTNAPLDGLGGYISYAGQPRQSVRWLYCPLTRDEIEWIFQDLTAGGTDRRHIVSALELCAIFLALVFAAPLLQRCMLHCSRLRAHRLHCCNDCSWRKETPPMHWPQSCAAWSLSLKWRAHALMQHT